MWRAMSSDFSKPHSDSTVAVRIIFHPRNANDARNQRLMLALEKLASVRRFSVTVFQNARWLVLSKLLAPLMGIPRGILENGLKTADLSDKADRAYRMAARPRCEP